ncbi:MAG TPA: nucleotide exchange factor GrpE [Gemmatimonadaceae bacterium]|nr:nucleotide exchange factor GrpE [Gemmatimonadaceae bacterium]
MRDRNRRPADAAESDQDQPAAESQGDGTGAEPVDAAPLDAIAPEVAHLDQQLTEQRDKYLRLAAEYDNFRKRSAKERMEASSRGQAELVARLLDALDDLQRFAHVDPASTDSQTLHKGIALVEQKALKALNAAGLEVINPVDQTFDPTLHEAVATEPALSQEDDHTVAKVFQPGYRFNGQLLRPARVVVKQWHG